jgi:hypothetical protein
VAESHQELLRRLLWVECDCAREGRDVEGCTVCEVGDVIRAQDDEIERLRAENQRLTDENARAWNACNEECERKEQLQALIDANIAAAAAHADAWGALLAAATPQEDDRG